MNKVFFVKLDHLRKLAINALFFLALFIFPTYSWAANLHAIIVCDTLAPGIEQSVRADLYTLKNRIKTISYFTGLELNETIFDGTSLTSNSLFTVIEQMTINPEDVVIFYYSGHGYRTESKSSENPWPTLYFSRQNRGVDFYALTEKITNKHPRLFISLSDCCNNIILDGYIPEVGVSRALKPMAHLSYEARERFNYETLFLSHQGTLIISSSKYGEFSWGTRYGGLYTNAFFENLDLEVRNAQNPSWSAILERTNLDVDDVEHPEYQILFQEN